jgi:hypothetical protein
LHADTTSQGRIAGSRLTPRKTWAKSNEYSPISRYHVRAAEGEGSATEIGSAGMSGPLVPVLKIQGSRRRTSDVLVLDLGDGRPAIWRQQRKARPNVDSELKRTDVSGSTTTRGTHVRPVDRLSPARKAETRRASTPRRMSCGDQVGGRDTDSGEGESRR